MVGLQHFLTLGAVIFAIGFFGAVTKRNLVVVLMCIELMFNAVNIVVVAMSKYLVPLAMQRAPDSAEAAVAQTLLTGQVFAVFVITVAAAEVALALGIVIAIYRTRRTADTNELKLMSR